MQRLGVQREENGTVFLLTRSQLQVEALVLLKSEWHVESCLQCCMDQTRENVCFTKSGGFSVQRVFSKTCELKSGVHENVCFNLKPCVLRECVC